MRATYAMHGVDRVAVKERGETQCLVSVIGLWPPVQKTVNTSDLRDWQYGEDDEDGEAGIQEINANKKAFYVRRAIRRGY